MAGAGKARGRVTTARSGAATIPVGASRLGVRATATPSGVDAALFRVILPSIESAPAPSLILGKRFRITTSAIRILPVGTRDATISIGDARIPF